MTDNIESEFDLILTRAQVEQRGLLTPREKHANGAQWIFWAEEPETNGGKK